MTDKPPPPLRENAADFLQADGPPTPMTLQMIEPVLRDLASLKERGWGCSVGYDPVTHAYAKAQKHVSFSGNGGYEPLIIEYADTPEAALAKVMERVEATE